MKAECPIRLTLPRHGLVLLVGASASGKSSFAQRLFNPTEVLSSDHYRAVVSDDENNQAASRDAFELIETIVEMRLRRGRLTIIDAMNLQGRDRRPFLNLAEKYRRATAAVVFDLPDEIIQMHNAKRTDRTLPPETISRQIAKLRRSLPSLEGQGIGKIYVLKTEKEIDRTRIVRRAMKVKRR